jgi:hypothetical protein
MNNMANSVLDSSREIVIHDYASASLKNQEAYTLGSVHASSEYIYDNQRVDASMITDKFYTTPTRVVSIVKRTKVGMDGLMIELAKTMATHPDNSFVLHRSNIFFITAMSNKQWEDQMKEKMPECFKNSVFHHGKLQRLSAKLKGIKNALIINDEIDSGDKEDQKLHLILKESGILDVKYMETNNIRFVFVSATMVNELRDLYKWGEKHYVHYMTIPNTYISHKDFLDLGIIREYYPVDNDKAANRWIKEDILDTYGTDFRVHIIRTDERYKNYIFNACIRFGINFRNHTSDERITEEELASIFENITNHTVVAVKGFYRRANLIPNEWKKKIGAMHERYVKKFDTNVQVQGLPGRMTGYWKDVVMGGHKTGPYRTSIEAIAQYEAFYSDPSGETKYSTNSTKDLFMNPKHVANFYDAGTEPSYEMREPQIRKFKTFDQAKEYYKKELRTVMGGRGPNAKKPDENGFYLSTVGKGPDRTRVHSTKEIYDVRRWNLNDTHDYTFYPCYENPRDKNTLQWWFIHY